MLIGSPLAVVIATLRMRESARVASTVAPCESVAVSVTLYVPAAAYVWLGFVAVDVPLSPNVQARDAIVPSLSVEPSVKLAVRPFVVKLKFATGGVLATGVPVKFLPVTFAPFTVTLLLVGENV